MESQFIVKCPHCNEIILIEEINCKIFRHGVFKNNLKQIDPHLSKEKCDLLINNKEIYGCGKPFRIIQKDNVWISEICDYI